MANFNSNPRGGLTVDRDSLHASDGYKRQIAAMELMKESEMAEKMTLDQAMYAVADKCANDETAWAAWLQVHAHLAQPAQAVGEPVAWLVTRDHDRTFPHVYISESSADAVVEWVTLPPFANKVPLYTAPPASPAVVPDQVRFAINRCIDSQEAFAERIDTANAGDPYASLMVRNDINYLRDWIAAAPSAPESNT